MCVSSVENDKHSASDTGLCPAENSVSKLQDTSETLANDVQDLVSVLVVSLQHTSMDLLLY